MTKISNILLVGVGGQGIVLASEVLASAALEDGLDVKKSEIHGMSQRGGSVTSHVRFGEQVFSPVIPKGQADILLAFERLEALRFVSYLRAQGMAIVNQQVIPPAPVLAGAAVYPENIEETIEQLGPRVIRADGLSLAKEAGHPLTVNMALLGAVSTFLPLSERAWEVSMAQHIKPAFLDVNRKAFWLGRNLVPVSPES
ncbi:MAG: indolepyruvate oxidoreductase subunit beta [Armatimonadota bacterium]